MKKFLMLLGSIILIVIIEAVFLKPTGFFYSDLLLVFLVFSSLKLKLKESLTLALCAGILKDTFLNFYFGINTFLFFLIIILGLYFSRRITLEREIFLAFYLFLISVLNSVFRFIFFLYLQREIPMRVFIANIFLESFTNLFLYFLLFRKFFELVFRERRWRGSNS